MGLWDSAKNQLRSVIEWKDAAPDALFEKWQGSTDEIKNASKLIVSPGQGCVFVYEGRVEGVYTEPGMVELKTANIPFWTTVTKFMQAFVSEHKVGIYFFRTAQVLDQKWGTTSPIKYDDPKYKFPVGLRAYGNYSMRITDPKGFFVGIMGARERLTANDFRVMMGARIVQPLTDLLAEGGFSYAEIDRNREELTQAATGKLGAEFTKLGFELADFRIEGTTFDDDTMARIKRIADMTAEAQAAAAVGLNYAGMQQLEALREAARNEGGAAGIGMGLGAGMGFGQMMGGMMGGMQQNMAQQQAPAAPAATAPGAPSADDPMAKLQKLKQMADMGLITADEFAAKKKAILDSM